MHKTKQWHSVWGLSDTNVVEMREHLRDGVSEHTCTVKAMTSRGVEGNF